MATPALVEKPLNSYPIIQFQDILIGGPSYSYLKDTLLSLKELYEYPLVCLSETTMTYRFYEEFYRRNHLTLKSELEVATTDQILPIIKNDLGIGFIPEIFAREALAKREVHQLSLAEKIPLRQVCLIENENHPLSIAAKELKKMLMVF